MIIKKAAWIIGILAGLAVLFLPGYSKIQELRDRNRDLAEKNRRLQAENSLLQVELKRMENDQVYQEKVLREKMGVVRKNEVPVKIVPQD